MARRSHCLLTLLCILRNVDTSVIISQNKPTAQSSDYRPAGTVIHPSKNAVDGKTIQTLGKDSCAHQAVNQTEVWWRVDLQSDFVIEKVEIYYREEFNWAGWKNRFAGYEIYLSNTTERRRQDRCFIDNSTSESQIQSHVTHSECYGTAQYVWIYNNREPPLRQTWYDSSALLELCEVQVY
ncbi:uncharacterized protein LOC132551785, partial [Ylistrum balloti]|uniref:uncharacterized protein LOC132551785 n=1 Tax=Ylistrum balloti TaxID=509963 RepID=UPI002905CE21